MDYYRFDICNFPDAEYKKWYSIIDAERRQQIDRLRSVNSKKQVVAGEMLLRKAVAKRYGILEETIRFRKNKYGKPYAVGLQVEFSISHSGGVVACALSDTPVGIDVEVIRPIDMHVARFICTSNDLKFLFGHMPAEWEFSETTDCNILTRFFKIWTAKEAFFKRNGTGITDFGSINYADVLKTGKYEQVVNSKDLLFVLY